MSKGRSLDAALARAEQQTAPDDISLLRMLAYGTLRHHWRLEEWIGQLLDRPLRKRDADIRALIAVGLFQLTDTRIPDHAAVSQTVEAARVLRKPKYAGLLNAVFRRFMREDMASQPAGTNESRSNHPGWLLDAFAKDWPDDAASIVAANNERAPMWLRVNHNRASTDDYVATLEAQGIEAESHPALPDALRLAKPLPVASLPGFAEGRVSVQDGGAQLAAPWLLAGLEGRVLDACAAPGGKTAHIKELGGDAVELTAVDIDPGRVDSIRENLARLELDATVLAGDASKPDQWCKEGSFDGILLDAPCSASGVIRRHPDIKLLRRASDIAALAKLQQALLAALWPLLAPGGRLLYVTCSVLTAENDAVVSQFLSLTPDARENDMLQNNNIRDVMRRKACGYQLLPGTAGLDGFYYACLEKVT